MKTWFLFLLSIAFVPSLMAQESAVSSMKIYADTSGGNTTVGAKQFAESLSAANSFRKSVSANDQELLLQLLDSQKPTKHKQTKFGTELVFAEVHYGDGTIHHFALTGIANTLNSKGEVRSSQAVVVDLTAMTQYEFTKPEALSYYELFLKNIR